MRGTKPFILSVIISGLLFGLLPYDSFSSEVTLFEKTFIRGKGTPITESVSFNIKEPSEDYTLLIINGNSDGSSRCSSAEISINGSVIAGPSDLNQQVSSLTKEVHLSSTNLLEVILRSAPDSFIKIKIVKGEGKEDEEKEKAKEKISIISYDASPNPFSPNGDGLFDTASLTARVRIEQHKHKDEEDHKYKEHHEDKEYDKDKAHRYFLRSHWELSGISIVSDKEITGEDSTEWDLVLNWDGIGGDGKVLPDGLYPYQFYVELIRVKYEKGEDEKEHKGHEKDKDDKDEDEKEKVIAESKKVAGTVTIDLTPPHITITNPVEGGILGSPAITVTGNIDDPKAGITINGVEGTNSGGSFQGSVTLGYGSNLITVEARDPVANTSRASVKVIMDNLAPIVTLDSLPEYTSGKTIEIKGRVEDITATTVTIQGKSASIPANGGPFSFTVDLIEGVNNLTVTAKDSAGNTSEASRSIILDTIPPVVKITSPTSGQYIGSHLISVSGTIYDQTPTKVKVNGFDATLSAGTFSISEVNLTEGANTIKAIATDSAGNTGTDEIMVISDTIPPVVTIDTPVDGMKTNIVSQMVSGAVTDSSPIASASINGIPLSISAGRYEYLYGLIEGLNTITIKAADMAGNNGSASVKAILDTIPPSSPLIDPLPVITNQINITVSGSSEPYSIIKVNGVVRTGADSSGRFSMGLTLNPDTLNSFTVTASDDVGNESLPATFSILQDSIPPSVSGFSLMADPKVTLLIPISIIFSEVIDPSTINSSNIIIQSSSVRVDGSFSISGAEVIFTPNSDFPPNQVFTLSVGSGVRDKAGNNLNPAFTVTFDTMIGPSFILGEVYDDTLGLPLEVAEIKVLKLKGETPEPMAPLYTDSMGRFSIEYRGVAGDALLEIRKDGYTRALRKADLFPNKSFTIFDARLTPVRSEMVSASAGGNLSAGDTILSIPPFSLPQDTALSLTNLSQQGLSHRLPIGWSPIYGVDISEDYRIDYNNERPHSSLGDLTPSEFMRLEEETAVGIL